MEILDSLPTCVLVHLDGVIRFANRAMGELVGHPPGDLVGRHAAELFVVSERTLPFPAGSTARRLVHRDGSVIPVEAHPFEIALPEGPASGVWITDQRAHKAMQTQLMFTERMASVGALAAGVAHEINNPLTYVLANTELLEAEAFRGPTFDLTLVRQLLAEIREGAERVQGTVRDLLVFSRNDDDEGPVDVRAVLESSISMAANQIRHLARLETEIAPVSPVFANQRKLGQVFLNLLVNAVQSLSPAEDDHEIRVTLSEEDGQVIVCVADTGTGIDPAVQDRIFEPFFTTKPAGIGTGLGLSICYSIIRTLRGEIQVRARPPRGTEFVVRLPTTVRDATPIPRSTPLTQPGRILVVDDDPLILRTVSRNLKRHRVVTLTDSEEALARLEQEIYDVIVCDVIMPSLSGIDVFRRACAINPDLAERFVFMSGGVFSDSDEEFFRTSRRPLLTKPFRREELAGLVSSTLMRLGPAA